MCCRSVTAIGASRRNALLCLNIVLWFVYEDPKTAVSKVNSFCSTLFTIQRAPYSKIYGRCRTILQVKDVREWAAQERPALWVAFLVSHCCVVFNPLYCRWQETSTIQTKLLKENSNFWIICVFLRPATLGVLAEFIILPQPPSMPPSSSAVSVVSQTHSLPALRDSEAMLYPPI